MRTNVARNAQMRGQCGSNIHARPECQSGNLKCALNAIPERH